MAEVGLFDKIKSAAMNKITSSADHLISTLPHDLRKHIDLDLKNLRLLISNTFIYKAVNYASSYSENITIMDLSASDLNEWYICRAKINDKVLNVRFIVDRIILENNKAVITFLTPNGIEIENRNILNLLAKTFISIFGGTEIGESVLSKKFPPNIRWDGKEVCISFDLPELEFSKLMKYGAAVITASQENRGLWFTFDKYETFRYIIVLIINRLSDWYCDMKSRRLW